MTYNYAVVNIYACIFLSACIIISMKEIPRIEFLRCIILILTNIIRLFSKKAEAINITSCNVQKYLPSAS